MAFLTKAQIEKLAEIIRLNATWLTWRLLGSQFITEEDLQKLKLMGLLPMDVQVESIRYAFVLGKLESLLKEGQWKNLEFDTLVSAATAKQTPVQELQIEAAELSALTQFRGLENDIQNGLFSALTNATNLAITEVQLKEKIKDIVKIGVEAHKNYREVARDLRVQLQDTKRNWHRVASTELHSARQRGVVAAILSGTDVYYRAEGADSNVTVRTDPDACVDCKRLYLDSSTGNPKVFKLSELLANEGTNYQRPWRVSAKPVIPPLHPNCYCMLRYVPPGWGWSAEGKFTLIDPETSLASVKSKKENKPMNKAHELLNQTSTSYMPTEDQISSLSVDDISAALSKIKALKHMHSDNPDLWHQLDDLETKVLVHHTRLRDKGTANVG